MDKITRILLMYAKLKQGEHIRKADFCLETEIKPRSFDRDIEDIRLYLADAFYSDELLYDRQENAYYLSGAQSKKLEKSEYRFLESVLLNMGLLRKDELSELLDHLASNTENRMYAQQRTENSMEGYEAPRHGKPLLKMHDDLVMVMDRQCLIELQYQDENGELTSVNVLPCRISYEAGGILLIAFNVDSESESPDCFQLERILSFRICRSQNSDEKKKVRNYLGVNQK